LLTARLRFEPLDERHLEGLYAMNSLPEVMRYISGVPESREQSAAMISRVQQCWAAWGTGWWALVELQSGRMAGAGAVQYLRRGAAPATDLELLRSNPLEIGWRLHPDFWRQGLASEAACRMAEFAFNDLAAPELLAVRHRDNMASQRVMDRLGMHFRGFEPWYGKTLATHSLSRDAWEVRQAQHGVI
jgi:RimJ/RimL family protein N-acetyltransferase